MTRGERRALLNESPRAPNQSGGAEMAPSVVLKNPSLLRFKRGKASARPKAAQFSKPVP